MKFLFDKTKYGGVFALTFLLFSVISLTAQTSCANSGESSTRIISPAESADTHTAFAEPTADNTETSKAETTQPEPNTAAPVKTEPETSAAPDTTAADSSAPETKSIYTQSGTKLAYLTFDDGPDKENTERIIETLDKYGIKATFFVVGWRAERCPDELKHIHEHGNKIGCHTYDHDYKKSTDPDGLKAEISDWESTVTDILGELPEEKLFRFPGGSPTDDKYGLKEELASLGYTGFDWNCLNNDCYIKKCPPDIPQDEWLKSKFKETYKYGSSLKHSPLIILMHETYSQSADMLGWVIEFLQDDGYSFATLDTLGESWYY